MLPSKSFIQSPQQYHQIQMLNSQQQQLLMQAQQAQQAQGNLGPTNLLTELESRRIKLLLSRNPMANKDGQPSGIGDVMQGVGSPMQAANQNNQELIMKVCSDYFVFTKFTELINVS